MNARRWWMGAWVALAVAEGAALGFLHLRGRWQKAAGDSPVGRGRKVAERMGCFGCHGPGGVQGSKNPGARAGGEVPSWNGGTWRMYNGAAADVRAWILDGHPADRAPDGKALVAMPAYRRRLSAAETADLVAFVLAVSQFGAIDDPRVALGQDAAFRYGCLGCHGPEGRGLVANPGSLKGYVPAWDGADFSELVQNDAELRQWIETGTIERFEKNPAARLVLATEALRMPAFKPRLKEGEADALVAYVKWVRAHKR